MNGAWYRAKTMSSSQARCPDSTPMIDRIYCHIVWTTRDRVPLIDAGLAQFLCSFLRGVATQERARILEIGMVRTHVHLLVRTRPTTHLARLLQRLKGGSAAIAGKEQHSTEDNRLRWAKGYSIHSVSPRSIAALRSYLRAADASPGRRHSRVGW